VRRFFKLVSSLAVALCSLQVLRAQDLAPRAYVITPLRSNALTLTYGFYDGSLLLNGALPVSNATGKYSVPTLSYYHSFEMFGHSANFVAALPYAVGNFEGNFEGVPTKLYRSALVDSTFRLAVNLKGGPPWKLPSSANGSRKPLSG
jgi:hypothetical protein